MIQTVIDTNVLVRALLKPNSSDGQIFQLVLDRNIALLYSQAMLTEVARVLTYPRIQEKYHLTSRAIQTFLKTVTAFGVLTQPSKKVSLCRDPDDNELLSIALSVSFEQPVFLITADRDLLVLKDQVAGVTIVNPWEFLHQIQAEKFEESA